MGEYFLRHQYPSLKRCEKCGNRRRFLYSIRLEPYTVLVCSSHCAELARANYQEKVDKGISPGQSVLQDDNNLEILEDNI